MHHDKVALSNAAGGRNLLDHDKRAELPSRKRSNENIDASRTHLNSDLSARKMDPGKAWSWAVAYAQEHASRKLRANQIVMSEDIIHLPDNWAEVSGGKPDSVFFESVALPFLRGRYGYGEDGTENEISAVVHRDEVVKSGPNAGHTTPHLHWKSVPVDRNGKLSHKSVHSRADLQSLHEDFSRFCAEKGCPGLHVYDADRAKAREDALSMPAYKQAMEEADRASERASEARKAAETAERAQKAAESRKRDSEAAAEASEKARKQAASDAEAAKKDLETQRRRAGQLGPDGEGINWHYPDGHVEHESSVGEVRAARAAEERLRSVAEKQRETAEADAMSAKLDAASARSEAEAWQAMVRDVQGISYKDEDGHERMGIKGMEQAYAAAQERLKAAQAAETAAVQQAQKAREDARAWRDKADLQQRRMGVRPMHLASALREMCRQMADVCLDLWRYARDAARRAWDRWTGEGLGKCADAFGVSYLDALDVAYDELEDRAYAHGMGRTVVDDLSRGPGVEQDQERGCDDWER